MIDKRAHERFAVTLAVVLVHGPERIEGRTRDVGVGGTFVHTEVRLPFGTELRVHVTLPGLKQESVIEATVRWHQGGGMGLAWKSLRAQEVWALNQLRKTSA